MSLFWAVLALLGAVCALAFIQGLGRALPVLVLVFLLAPDVSHAKATSSSSAFQKFKELAVGTGKTTVTAASNGTPLAAPGVPVADTDGGQGVKVTGSGQFKNPSGNRVTANVLARVGQSVVARRIAAGVALGLGTGGIGLPLMLLDLLAELKLKAHDRDGNGSIELSRDYSGDSTLVWSATDAAGGNRLVWLHDNAGKDAACNHRWPGAIGGNSNECYKNGTYQGGINEGYACFAGNGSNSKYSASALKPAASFCAGHVYFDPATIQDLENEIASKSGWPSTSNLAPAAVAAADMLKQPYAPDVETVTGPAQSPGPAPKQSEKLNPDGSKQQTTQTVVHNHTYNGNTINTTTVTTTVVNNINPAGDVTSTETTTETEEPEAEEAAPTWAGHDLPERPTLYERKYPDGLVGVWNARKAQLQSSALLTLAAQLMPSVLPVGSCPAWNLDLSLGPVAAAVGWDFGTYDVAPPCWLWPAAASIVIVSALILARALVFGG